MKIPLKIALPVLACLVCVPLMVWDIHNQRVIASMGMGWDTGAPLWPYQTPDTLLFAFNTPAFLISALFGSVPYYFKFGLIGPLQYITFFPAVLVWWWLVGLYFDKNNRTTKMRKTTRLLCYFLAIGLFICGVEESRWAAQWWWTYSRTLLSVTDLILLRLTSPSIWCFALGIFALKAARRQAQVESSSSNVQS
jgi:hypothetical protein